MRRVTGRVYDQAVISGLKPRQPVLEKKKKKKKKTKT